MGKRLAAKWPGECEECESKWKKNEMIFWDGKKKNKIGKQLTCSNWECFHDQGGTLDENMDAKTVVEDFTFFKPKFTNKIIEKKLREEIKPILGAFLVVADEMTHEEVPHLDPKHNVYGQIRNANTTHLINLFLWKEYKKNES